MSLTASHDEGLTVITITSNVKSKWPVLCQILGSLYYSLVCSVSQDMKRKLTYIHTALGIMQMILSVISITVENLFAWHKFYSLYTLHLGPFWFGGVFLVVGIACILHAKFPSTRLLVITVFLNVVNAVLAMKAVVLYSTDLIIANSFACAYCNSYSYHSQTGYSDLPSAIKDQRTKICLDNMIVGGLDIIIILLSVLQLCVTISFCVLTRKVLCKKDKKAKSLEDPELIKLLTEDDTAGAA